MQQRVPGERQSSACAPQLVRWYRLRVPSLHRCPQTLKYEWAWATPSVVRCGVRRRMPPEIAAALSYRRVVFIGDAHVRRVHNWLAWALLGEAEC